MKKKFLALLLATVFAVGSFTACGDAKQEEQKTQTEKKDVSDKVASKEEMSTVTDVVEEGMEPIEGKDVADGEYTITVDSSSSMFKIVDCKLTVKDGEMTAVMTMGGTGYKYIYMGTGEEAVDAKESDYISPVENAEGAHTFTVPVEALNKGIACTAFSAKKEKWYDRTLLFRADSLPAGAYTDPNIVSCGSLNLENGTYTVEVKLSGGSGRASVESPAKLEVKDGNAVATIVWSSPNYDYMLVEGQKYLNIAKDGNSTFEIPVTGFDYEMPVVADTTAMSEPHEISYTLHFESDTIK
ncbi:MAG: hypothetical protein PUB24_05395 [Lachnospiraceae bacterium]|nr:hypothetical protein [Lachnospiraceae bacterium]MDD6192496.1 hypothetical protein [Lachnospiraceae bacterium]MDY4793835.1 hypothetical protein [Pararoseburia sp.]